MPLPGNPPPRTSAPQTARPGSNPEERLAPAEPPTSTLPTEPSWAEARERLESAGQLHLLRFWDALDRAARDRLASQLACFDPTWIRRTFASATERPGLEPGVEPEPPPVRRHPAHGGDPAARREARDAGEAWLAQGAVAALVVAGGQGSRLAFPGPKGAFPIGPVSQRSLFGLQAQRLRGLSRRFGRPLRWLVMTSPATDAATRALFRREDHFGLGSACVRFFCQASLPVLDPRGRMLLEAPDRLAMAPDGHGGVLTALRTHGVLEELAERGIEVLHHDQVDNPLVPVADPVLLGFHRLEGAEMTCKVVARRSPADRMGTLIRHGGGLRVVEYSEIREPQRSAREPDGSLRFWAGSIGVHAYSPALVRRLAGADAPGLPYHAARKRVEALDPDGSDARPRPLDAVKLERFVFDALPFAEGVAAVEACREEEYAPVKSLEGSETPRRARAALSALYRSWLREAGVEAPRGGVQIEVDHSRIPGPEELRKRGLRSWHQAGDAIVADDGARA